MSRGRRRKYQARNMSRATSTRPTKNSLPLAEDFLRLFTGKPQRRPDDLEAGHGGVTGRGRSANLASRDESLNVLEGAVDFFFGVVVVGGEAETVAGVG